MIGAALTTNSPFGNVDGIIDEVRISNVARDACWIDANYDNQNDPATFFGLGPRRFSPPGAVRSHSIPPAAFHQ